MFRNCAWIVVLGRKKNFLPFFLIFLPVFSGVQTTWFHALWLRSFLFPFPILYFTWQLNLNCEFSLTWECWPWNQQLDLFQLPYNSKCSHVKASVAHGRFQRKAGTLLSRVKTVPLLSISSIPEKIKAGDPGL